MIEGIGFSLNGFEDYTYWQTEDKRILKKINTLIRDVIRNGNNGLGHPEPLKGNLSGKWSREINDKDRLVYEIFEDGTVMIYQCKGHYSDK